MDMGPSLALKILNVIQSGRCDHRATLGDASPTLSVENETCVSNLLDQ